MTIAEKAKFYMPKLPAHIQLNYGEFLTFLLKDYLKCFENDIDEDRKTNFSDFRTFVKIILNEYEILLYRSAYWDNEGNFIEEFLLTSDDLGIRLADVCAKIDSKTQVCFKLRAAIPFDVNKKGNLRYLDMVIIGGGWNPVHFTDINAAMNALEYMETEEDGGTEEGHIATLPDSEINSTQ